MSDQMPDHAPLTRPRCLSEDNNDPNRMNSVGHKTAAIFAQEASYLGYRFKERTGQVRFDYDVDGWTHSVHSVFHDLPALAPEVWNCCLEDLALACLLDLGTASLARRLTAHRRSPATGVSHWAHPAAKALRVESLSALHLPLRHLPFDLHLHGVRTKHKPMARPDKRRVLLLMGGGKDSLFSYELLRAAGFEVECFYMVEACRTWQQLRQTYHALGARTTQHRAFLNANQMGRIEQRFRRDYLTQFQVGQAIFLSIPYALGRQCRYIAVGAERSANTPTGIYRGTPMNHQYEKSEDFFIRLNRYLDRRYDGAVQVFSPLHGLFDLGIYGRLLSRQPELVRLQSSCGGSNARRRHCGQCEKCAFVAVLFTALSDDEPAFRSLFPVNPLDNVELFDEWYHGRFGRPRACVGSLSELRVALRLGRARGWRSAIHSFDRGKGDPPGSRELSRYLSVHATRAIPEEIRRRTSRVLDFDAQALRRVFESSI